MRCPFLREAQVKFCRASAYRKMIVRLAEQPANERCSSAEYVHCPAAKQHLEERPSADHCPFLHESLVQYCTAAAVTKYIPYTESVLSQCGTESHKYCELYLGLAAPDACTTCAGKQNGTTRTLDGLKVPGHLHYAPNHMWMDISADGVCHIGVDAFLTKVLGSIDQITFVTSKGIDRPTVSFNIRGVDLQFVFPKTLSISRANTYLRTNPEKIMVDPYTFGWLFEATIDRNAPQQTITEGLISNDAVQPWMHHEMERMTALAHQAAAQPDMRGAVLMADGGTFSSGFARKLPRESLLKLYNEFFSPLILWTTP